MGFKPLVSPEDQMLASQLRKSERHILELRSRLPANPELVSKIHKYGCNLSEAGGAP